MTQFKPTRRTVLAGLGATAAAAAFPSLAFAGDDVYPIANPFPEDEPWAKILDNWKTRIMKNNDGKFKLPIKSGADVGGQAQVLKAVKNGKYAGALVTHYAFHELVPRLDIFDLPYLFKSTELADVKVALKAAKDDIKVALENNGLHLVWLFHGGRRVLVSVDEPLLSLTDMKGAAVACRPGSAAPAGWEAMGVVAREMPINDITGKLANKQLKAGDVSILEMGREMFSYSDRSKQLKQAYLTETYHSVNVGFLVMNKEAFDGMKGKEQELLVGDREKRQDALAQAIRDAEAATVETLKGQKVTVRAPNKVQRDQTEAAAKTAHQAWLADRKPAQKIYNAVRKG